MNKVLFRIVVVLAGAVATAVLFLLGPPILHLLHRFFPETTMPEDMSWRVAVTITFATVYLIVFGILGWIMGRVKPSGGWTWGLWLSIFPVLTECMFIFVLGVVYPLTALAAMTAAIAGAVAGSQVGSGLGGTKE